MSGFLPDEYKLPKSEGRYMKFEEGANKIRILSSAITGWEYWVEEDGNRKPKRVENQDELPQDLPTSGEGSARHFWAFVVYNYALKDVQILELTQKGIMSGIKALVDDEDWGDPKEYDITITKTKTGQRDMDVEYSVMPRPKSEIEEGIEKYYKDLKVNLKALYDGSDPFKNSKSEKTDEELIDESIKESEKDSDESADFPLN